MKLFIIVLLIFCFCSVKSLELSKFFSSFYVCYEILQIIFDIISYSKGLNKLEKIVYNFADRTIPIYEQVNNKLANIISKYENRSFSPGSYKSFIKLNFSINKEIKKKTSKISKIPIFWDFLIFQKLFCHYILIPNILSMFQQYHSQSC